MQRPFRRKSLAIGPVRSKRVVDVGDLKDARGEWNLFAFRPSGYPSRPAFVVVANDRQHIAKGSDGAQIRSPMTVCCSMIFVLPESASGLSRMCSGTDSLPISCTRPPRRRATRRSWAIRACPLAQRNISKGGRSGLGIGSFASILRARLNNTVSRYPAHR